MLVHTRLTLSVLLLAAIFSGCTSGEESAKAGEALTIKAENYRGSADYRADIGASLIYWSGNEVVSGKEHRGTLKLNEGTFYIKKGEMKGGQFEIDMRSLTVKDLEAGDGKERLEGHLASDDFFSIEEHPTAEFEIASITGVDSIESANAMVTGNLRIKGITKSISIPAKISINDQYVTVMSPEFTINRTDWDVNFRAGFLGTAKDKVISDLLTIRLRIKGDNPDNAPAENDQPTE